MIEDIRDAPAGPLVARQGVFSPAELDAIEAYGESLAPRKAEIAGRGDNTSICASAALPGSTAIPKPNGSMPGWSRPCCTGSCR
jgi:hypothetical protein